MEIKGLTHKMKNRVREHGKDWYIYKQSDMPQYVAISPEKHKEKVEPYIIWVLIGKDIEVVK